MFNLTVTSSSVSTGFCVAIERTLIGTSSASTPERNADPASAACTV